MTLTLTELLKSRTDPTELAATATAGADAAAAGLLQQPGAGAAAAAAGGQAAAGPFVPPTANGGSSSTTLYGQQQQQQQQQQPAGGGSSTSGPASGKPPAPSTSPAPASAAARQLLAKPLADFATSRREWTLKVAKAVAQGFFRHAEGALTGQGAAWVWPTRLRRLGERSKIASQHSTAHDPFAVSPLPSNSQSSYSS